MPGKRVTEEERVRIEVLWGQGLTQTQIAQELGRHKSTIGRELARNGSGRHGIKHGNRRPGVPLKKAGHGRCGRNCRFGYTARTAHAKATVRARRPRPSKLGFGPNRHGRGWSPSWGTGAPTALRLLVLDKLRLRWSPAQISGWLKTEHADDRSMQISPEAIYQAVYVQSRGNLREELRDQLALRSGRTRRRARAVAAGPLRSGRPWTHDFNISTRPAEVEDRAVPGHWEGDLVVGKNNGSAVLTLVERRTRYVMLGALPHGRDTRSVVAVLQQLAARLPAHLMQTLTWDNGSELAGHAAFTVATGCAVFFADPHHPWQRGSNENTNGLLRQYYPKGMDLSQVTQQELDAVAAEMNDRPRQTLGWQTPRQELTKLLVATTA